MSKTKGNVINPLDVAKDYGVDALRFGLSWIAAPAQHVSFGMTHVEHGRNFMTKLWNMSRFLMMNELVQPALSFAGAPQWVWNRWILGQLSEKANILTEQLETYRFHEAAATVYEATWSFFCDWYIECVKDALRHQPHLLEEIRATTTVAMRTLLSVLHPFVPFMTEKLWSLLGFEGLLCHQQWPDLTSVAASEEVEEAEWLKAIITQVRRVRSEFRLPSAPLQVCLSSLSKQHESVLKEQKEFLCRFLKLEDLSFSDQERVAEKGWIHALAGEACVSVKIGDLVDVASEKARLKKALEEAAKKEATSGDRLSSSDFLEKAPLEVVEELRNRLEEAVKEKQRYTELLESLDG